MSPRSVASVLVCAALVLSFSGCGALLHESAQDTAAGAVEGSVKEMDSPETRRALAAILADPETERAVGAFAEAAAGGALDSLTEPERTEQLARAAEAIASRVTLSLLRDIKQDLQPAIAQLVAQSVELSIERALSPEAQQGTEDMFAAMTRGALRGIDESTADGELTTLSAATRGLAKEAALGFQDAVRVSAERRETTGRDRGNVLAAMSETADATLSYGPWLFVAALVSAVVVLLIALWLFARALRRPERDSDVHPAHAASALAAALRSLESGERSAEVRAKIEELARRDGGESDLLKRILRNWPNASANQQTDPGSGRAMAQRA